MYTCIMAVVQRSTVGSARRWSLEKLPRSLPAVKKFGRSHLGDSESTVRGYFFEIPRFEESPNIAK